MVNNHCVDCYCCSLISHNHLHTSIVAICMAAEVVVAVLGSMAIHCHYLCFDLRGWMVVVVELEERNAKGCGLSFCSFLFWKISFGIWNVVVEIMAAPVSVSEVMKVEIQVLILSGE